MRITSEAYLTGHCAHCRGNPLKTQGSGISIDEKPNYTALRELFGTLSGNSLVHPNEDKALVLANGH